VTELEFLPQPYVNSILEKPHIFIACICTEFSQALLMPYESFVILLKSRSHTHHPHRHYPYTRVGVETCHPSRSIQKYFTPTLGGNTKKIYIPYRLPQNKCSKLLLLSLKYFHCSREAWVMQKLFKKRKY
jgi:hypothetical protein